MPLTLGLQPIPILVSLEGNGAATVGIHNPVLVLPECSLSHASEDELASMLGHGLAHIRWHDFLLNLVYELLILPISFHPAATPIKARIDQTRGLACDEIAAEGMSTRTQHASSLLSIAQSVAAYQRRLDEVLHHSAHPERLFALHLPTCFTPRGSNTWQPRAMRMGASYAWFFTTAFMANATVIGMAVICGLRR
jgi:beta-lactamase regulating signal transducer with metallopeptidase domain